MRTFGLGALIALLPAGAFATTWDEPWMDEVVSNAESLVRVTVVSNSSEEVEAKVTKHLAGTETPTEIRLVGFSLLRLGSYSRPGPGFPFQPATDYYLFLKKAPQGAGYLIATPSAGWADVGDRGVSATFRHSYHKALVPEDVYETTMVAIFNKMHGKRADEMPARRFVSAELSKPPAGLKEATDETQARFFLQHAALETFRHLGSEQDLALIDPFLETDDYHVQISAVRALGCVRSDAVRRRLMDFIEGDRYGFAKVVAVWELKAQGAKEMLPRLRRFLADGVDEETGFGGDLMDSRIGTVFPGSVKEAVRELVAVLEAESEPRHPGAERERDATSRRPRR